MTLREITFFQSLSDKEIEEIASFSRFKIFQKDDVLFYEGDSPTYLHIITQGILKVFKSDAKGNELIMGYFKPQNMIAELANMESIPFPASAVFETDGEALLMRFSDLSDFMDNHPFLYRQIIRSLNKKIISLEQTIAQHISLDTECRLIMFILKNEDLLPIITQRKIATILQSTPETISRIVAKLKKLNLLKGTRGQVEVVDKPELQRYFSRQSHL